MRPSSSGGNRPGSWRGGPLLLLLAGRWWPLANAADDDGDGGGGRAGWSVPCGCEEAIRGGGRRGCLRGTAGLTAQTRVGRCVERLLAFEGGLGRGDGTGRPGLLRNGRRRWEREGELSGRGKGPGPHHRPVRQPACRPARRPQLPREQNAKTPSHCSCTLPRLPSSANSTCCCLLYSTACAASSAVGRRARPKTAASPRPRDPVTGDRNRAGYRDGYNEAASGHGAREDNEDTVEGTTSPACARGRCARGQLRARTTAHGRRPHLGERGLGRRGLRPLALERAHLDAERKLGQVLLFLVLCVVRAAAVVVVCARLAWLRAVRQRARGRQRSRRRGRAGQTDEDGRRQASCPRQIRVGRMRREGQEPCGERLHVLKGGEWFS